MSENKTSHYGLNMPDYNEFTDIADLNENSDIIDRELFSLNNSLGTKVDKISGKGLSANDYTAADKTKLDGIAENANKYIHPAGSGANKANGLYKITTDSTSHISGAAAVVKADITALGIPAHDTTYSVATQSANGLMSAADKTKLDIVSNENILINSDFRKLVNQRSISSTSQGYFIDRWFVNGEGVKASVMDGKIRVEKISSNSAGGAIRQNIEFPEQYYGKTITVSIETSNGIYFASGIAPTANLTTTARIPLNDKFECHFHRGAIGTLQFAVYYPAAGHGHYVDIIRAKLELGSVSTLANDPPVNYGTELTKCQRYQLAASYLHFRATSMSPDIIDFRIPTPVGLRISPTLAAGSLKVYSFPNSAEQTGFTLAALYTAESGQIVVNMKKNGHGLTDAYLRVMDAIFDAEIY